MCDILDIKWKYVCRYVGTIMYAMQVKYSELKIYYIKTPSWKFQGRTQDFQNWEGRCGRSFVGGEREFLKKSHHFCVVDFR